MNPRKWVEINIHTRDNPEEVRKVLLSFVKPFVDHYKERVESWHYFIEPCPEEGPRPGETEVRLRFYGQAGEIDTIRDDLDSQLLTLTKQVSPVTYHHFGNHGKPEEQYGEFAGPDPGYWGRDVPIVVKQFQNGAEFGLYFLRKFPLDSSSGRHGHRYAHLLLNQLLIPHWYRQIKIQVFSLTIQE